MRLFSQGMMVSLAGILTGIINFGFQIVAGRNMSYDEFGFFNTTQSLMFFLMLPMAALHTTISHHVAYFRSGNETELLRDLLGSTQKLLLYGTLVGCLGSIVLTPLMTYAFEYPRESLMLVTLLTSCAMMWTGYVSGVLTGFAAFGWIAVIQVATAVIRLTVGLTALPSFPIAEVATGAAMIACMASIGYMFYRHGVVAKSQGWSVITNIDFWKFCIAALAIGLGNFIFMQGDLMVAQKKLEPEILGVYSGAGIFGRAVVYFSMPMLGVIFASRSAQRSLSISRGQWALAGLLLFGVVSAGIMIEWLSSELSGLVFKNPHEITAVLVTRFAWSMLPVALVMLLTTWALASRDYFSVTVFALMSGWYAISQLLWSASAFELLDYLKWNAWTTFLLITFSTLISFRLKVRQVALG